MPATMILGAQWGDEGKGKITDYFAEKADFIVRFQGGTNAGHTIVIGDEKYKLHLIPSGILRSEKTSVIANGVVLDPEVLIFELNQLKKRGLEINNFFISERAHVIMPYHKLIDGLEEKLKGKKSVGTTKKGIGPCYSDKISRLGIRVTDLLDKETLEEKLDFIIPIKQKIINSFSGEEDLSKDKILVKYLGFGKELKKYVINSPVVINKALNENKFVLFEGAQGTQLDIDHGTYPYATSSNTIAGGGCTGSGISPLKINSIIGIVKAYTTRVGLGPLPTELKDKNGDYLREKGGEYGTTTGRPRRCGWLDMVVVRYACMLNGFTEIVITKLDVLSNLKKLKICKGYQYNGETFYDFPTNLKILKNCKPIYDELDGWDMDVEERKKIPEKGYDVLPKEAKEYLEYIVKDCKTRIGIVSIGARRNETIKVPSHNLVLL